MISIDKKLCISCGACATDCLLDNIHLEDGKAVFGERCIGCGHCVAVCPVKAVSIPSYDMEDVEEYDQETFVLKPEQYLHAVKFRRSIRSYENRPVEEEKLEQILQAGRYTPTAANRQACRFYVVKEQLPEWKEQVWKALPTVIELLWSENGKMAVRFEQFLEEHKKDPKRDSLFFQAPVFLAVEAPDSFDAGLAAANMENMAVAQGLGVLYSGYLTRIIGESQELKQWLGLSDRAPAICMLLGYPSVNYKRTAPRKPADIVRK